MQSRIDVPCPQCGSTLKVSLDEIAAQRTKRCPRGHSVRLVDEGGGARQVRDAEQKLDRELRKLSRTIRF